jgi:pilus assembly protein Flp/PilA
MPLAAFSANGAPQLFPSFVIKAGITPMLKYYVKANAALTLLRTDKDGVVSFEYVIVAACIVAAVTAAFGTTTGTGIGAALSTAIGSLTTAVTAAA